MEQNTNNPMNQTAEKPYEQVKAEFAADVRSQFNTLKSEISERNASIRRLDDYVYGEAIRSTLDIPIGHDNTPVNWLKRTVEIHKNMFMGRGFTVSSTYNTNDLSQASDDGDRKRMEIENQKNKQYAEARMNTIKSIMEDNGGDSFWATLAENASAIGDVAVKMFYNPDDKKIELSQIENIENLYALWNSDDFRKVDAYGYAFQVNKMTAIKDFGAPDNVTTSPLGSPMDDDGGKFGTISGSASSQQMVTILEVTGKVQGWGTEKGKLKKVSVGKENIINTLLVGDIVTRVIDNEKKMPYYYILHNKTQRRRAWGLSDITEGCINLQLTYIETLSDWRTIASKVNFPKYIGMNFGPGVQMPAFDKRKIQVIPMSDTQSLTELGQGDANGLDWGRQLDEIQAQYIRESGVARALFDDPSVTLNSNQALVTSMKTTTDIAEAKKQLWAPVIKQMFTDALTLASQNMPDIKDAIQPDDNWSLKVMWPSVMQADDPQYQTMQLNRFNAGLLSVQSYMESLGESKEEIDRIREEMTDPITSAIMGHQIPLVAQSIINAATAEIQAWYQMMQPQTQMQAQQQQADQQAQAQGNTPGVNSNGGGAAPAQIAGQSQNQPGQQPMSQPGTGATTASLGGAIAQQQQNAGQ